MRKMRFLMVGAYHFELHFYQLARLLQAAGYEVEILLTGLIVEPVYLDLVEKLKVSNFKIFQIQDSEQKIWPAPKTYDRLYRYGFRFKSDIISHNVVSQARSVLKGRIYDRVIAVEPHAVYLAYKLFPRDMGKVIHYSLEVVEESSSEFKESRYVQLFVGFMRRMLPRMKALIIQDNFRADILLKRVSRFPRKKVICFPVSVTGAPVESRQADYFQELIPDRNKTRILFFGGLWRKDLLQNLKDVSAKLPPTQVLIIHGGRGFVKLEEEASQNLVISTKPVNFDELSAIISSVDIGLALYEGQDLNHQFTAFSSEKIARYTQCGLPFIAFRFGNYEYMRSETGCCELIDKLEDLPQAVELIRNNYAKYREAAFLAYKRFYHLESTSRDLLSFLQDDFRSDPNSLRSTA